MCVGGKPGSGIEMSRQDSQGVPTSILQGIYCLADVCVCQALTVNFWDLAETIAEGCVAAVGAGRY